MDVAKIALAIYCILCLINGIVLASADVDSRTWQFWVLIVCFIGAYLCGFVMGGSL